jgi:hypothetical protein
MIDRLHIFISILSQGLSLIMFNTLNGGIVSNRWKITFSVLSKIVITTKDGQVGWPAASRECNRVAKYCFNQASSP